MYKNGIDVKSCGINVDFEELRNNSKKDCNRIKKSTGLCVS